MLYIFQKFHQQAAADYNQYGQNEFYDPYNQQQPHSDGQNQQQNYQKEDFNQQLYDQVQHQNNETEVQVANVQNVLCLVESKRKSCSLQ